MFFIGTPGKLKRKSGRVSEKQWPCLRVASEDLLHIDLLRFIASAGIVFDHSRGFFFPIGERVALEQRTVGISLFLDLFFVISGFVVSHVYHDRVSTLRDYGIFLQRRVGRLVPLHWITLFLSVLLWATFVLAHYSGAHTPSFSPACIADTALLLHSYFPCGNHLYFNGQSWSISAEMGLYVVFPVFAFLGSRNALVLLGVFLAYSLAVVGFAVDHQGFSLNIDVLDMYPVLRALLSFLLGMAFYYNKNEIGRAHV